MAMKIIRRLMEEKAPAGRILGRILAPLASPLIKPSPGQPQAESPPVVRQVPGYPGHPEVQQLAAADFSDHPLVIPEQLHDELRLIRDKLALALAGKQHPMVGLVAASRGEGATTVALKLALTALELPWKVLLVDTGADAGLTRLLHLEGQVGLSDLNGLTVAISQIIYRTGLDGLEVVPAGTGRDSDLTQLDWPQVLGGIRPHFDLVVVDLPPVLTSALSLKIAPLLDGLVLVVAAHRTRKEVLRHTQAELHKYGAGNILGFVLNQRQYFIPEFLYRHF